MKVSEDRFPLLFVYFEEQEEPYDVRAKTITKGAAEILSRWPHYLTFASYMSVIGLLSLLVCFILSVLVLSFTTTEIHNPRKFSLVKCDGKRGSSHFFHLNAFDRLIDTENATFIVDVASERRNRSVVACSIESYVTRTTLPVYHVQLVPSNASADNASVFHEFEKRFDNYRTLTFPVGTFLSGTAFTGSLGEGRLRLVSKALISWNFGGTVLDSDLLALADFRDVTRNPNDTLLVGLVGDDAVLVSARRVCHSFVFGLMRHLERDGNATGAAATGAVYRDFCSPGRNCSSIRIASEPVFCGSSSPDCVFLRSGNATVAPFSAVCPLAKSFS